MKIRLLPFLLTRGYNALLAHPPLCILANDGLITLNAVSSKEELTFKLNTFPAVIHLSTELVSKRRPSPNMKYSKRRKSAYKNLVK